MNALLRLAPPCLRDIRRAACLLALLLGLQPDPARAAVFTTLPDLTEDEDTGPIEVPVELDPAPLSATAYRLDASSDNPELLPPGSMTVEGLPPRAVLRIRTAPNASGVAQIRLRAQAIGLSEPVMTSFRLTVRAVDDPPEIKPVPNQVMTEGIPLLRIPIEVTDPDSGFQLVATVPGTTVPDPTKAIRASAELSGGRWFVTLRPAERLSIPLPARTSVRVTGYSGNQTNSITFFVTLLPRDFQSALRLTGVPQWGAFVPTAPSSSSLVAWADVNRDGYPDAVIPSSRQIALNPRVSTISPGRLSYGTPNLTGYTGTQWTDLNGDGVLDSCAWRAGALDVLITRLTQGNPTFVRNTSTRPALAVAGATFADLDGNGTQDLVYTGVTNEVRRVITVLNDGDANLTVVSNALPALAGPVVAADFNRDGRTDLLLCEGSRRGISSQVFYNQGGLQFVAGPEVSDFNPVTSAGTTDINGDGLPDLWLVQAVNGNQLTLELRVLVQEGGQFREVLYTPSDEFRSIGAPSWGDFNQDGLVDFIAPSAEPLAILDGTFGSTNLMMLYQNRGGGRFEPTRFLFPLPSSINLPTGQANTFVPSAADIDQDGDLDIVGYDLGFRPFYNQQTVPNLAPDTPEGLRGFVVGDDLYLVWSGARDANQTVPLTFNVRVGTTPGGNEVIPSNSLVDGTRMIPAPGNAGFATFHSIRLPRRDLDQLYCSVQAVDASFAGGPFAPEIRIPLEIPGNQAPTIDAPTEVSLNEDEQDTVQFTVADDRTREVDVDVTARVEGPLLFDSQILPVTRFTTPDGSFRRMFTLAPMANANGETTVRIVAKDRNQAVRTHLMTVTVRSVNDRPTAQLNISPLHHTGTHATGTLSIADPETLSRDLRVAVESSDPALLPPDRIEISGTGDVRTLVARPVDSRAGTVTLTVRVTDPEGAEGVASAVITWQPQLLEADPAFSWAAELRDATWVDFNADGRLDVVGHRTNGVVEIWVQNSGGDFQLSSAINTGKELANLHIGDLDGDGDADLLAARHYPQTTGDLYILWNEGGAITRWTTLVLGGALTTEALLDVDGDGDLDVATGDEGGVFRLLRNAPGVFGGPTNPAWEPLPLSNASVLQSLGPFRPSFQVVDSNHDGLPDLQVSWSTENGPLAGPVVLMALVQIEPDLFQVVLPQWPQSSVLVGVGDFDNDGRSSFLLANETGQTTTPVLISDDFRFASALPLNGSSPPLGDVDGDGFTDLLGFRREPWGSFALMSRVRDNPVFIAQRPPEYGLRSFSAGDMNHDGTLEVWARTATGSILLRNAGGISNRPPSVPTDVRIRHVEQGILEISWAAATDAEQTGGLTYNVRLGTTPGSQNVVSALALPDGRGLVPTSGNAGGRTTFRVRGVNRGGTYHASVQAVDAGFARSAFAPDVSITVDAFPTISALSNFSLPRNAGRQQTSFTLADEETPANQLQLTVESSNPVLLPASRLRLLGTDAGRVLEFEPKPDRAGAATIRLRVTDGAGNTAERTFDVFVPTATPYAVEISRVVEVPNNAPTVLHLDDFDPDGDFLEYRIETLPRHGRLEGTGPAVTYQPDAGFEGEDSLVFVATTPGSFPARGQVTLRVVPGHRLQPEVRLAGAGQEPLSKLVVRGPSGARVRVEHSTDLKQWERGAEGDVPTSETLLLDLPATGGSSAHFYRVVTLP